MRVFETLMQSRSTVVRALVALVAVSLAVMALFGGRLASAQEAHAPHLAHIHPGTCEELDPNPEYPLTDVSGEFGDGEASQAGDTVGASDATLLVEGSTTIVPVSLDDLLAEEYAINLHESAEAADVYIACGNVAGVMVGDNLVVGLAEENDSGHSGVAVLAPDGDETTVTVYVNSAAAAGDDAAEGEATPDDATAEADAGDAAAGEEAVAIASFAFGPDELTIPVGTTVTWTNEDSAPHTATAEDGSFDSGRLERGDSFSYTFEEAGEFAYFCDIHPNMKATITVE